MWRPIRSFLDAFAAQVTIWSVFGTLVISSLTAWLAHLTTVLDATAPVSWAFAALLAALAWLSLIFLFVGIRSAWVDTSLKIKRNSTPSQINPLDRQFHLKRVKLAMFADPVDGTVKSKSFSECEILGPVNIYMQGRTLMNEVNFAQCDVVVLRPKWNRIYEIGNAMRVKDCSFDKCKIIGATIYIHHDQLDNMLNNVRGINVVSFTGRECTKLCSPA